MRAREKENQTELLTFVEELKRQWMATIDALSDPLIILDPEYNILKANLAMAKLNSQNIKKIISKKCYKVFAQRSSPCPGCKVAETMKQKKTITFELEDVRNGQVFEVSSHPLFDEKNTLTGIVHTYRDRTEDRRLRDQLIQSEKLSSIGLLAGGIAHEINNPLGGIMVFAQMLHRELPTDSPYQTDVKEIINAAQRCKGIVEGLLDFARTGSVTKKNTNEKFNATEAIHAALRFARVSIPSHRIKIEEEWLDDGREIFGDRNRAIQLFLNLIQNAVQAMPEGGTLALRSRTVTDKNESTHLFEISDTGTGIAKANQKKIFDPFFTTKEPGEGTGLGLAICYTIVQEMGGNLTFKSREKKGASRSHGTTFIVSLPVKTPIHRSMSESA